MASVRDLLHGILRMIRNGCGADSVSLFVLLPTAEGNLPLLVHEGDADPVPELKTIPDAEAFIAALGGDAAPVGTVPGGDPGSQLVPVPSLVEFLGGDDGPAEADRRQQAGADFPGMAAETGPTAWLGIRGGTPVSLDRVLAPAAGAEGAPLQFALGSLVGCRSQMVCTTEMDPISRLPVRSAYPVMFRKFAGAGNDGTWPGLLLVNPYDFNMVNDRFGREAGDGVIEEIAATLNRSVRSTDFVFRYGAAMFGVLLPSTDQAKIRALAEHLLKQLSGGTYHQGELQLRFCIGGAVSGSEGERPEEDGAPELARRADVALSAAKRAGGQTIRVWSERLAGEVSEQMDSLSSIFTADPSRDYRNMRLLWDTVRLIASSTDVEQMKTSLLRELVGVFDLQSAGVYDDNAAGGGWQILRRHDRGGRKNWVSEVDPGPDLEPDRRRVMTAGKTWSHADRRTNRYRCLIPLRTGERTLGCLLLEGAADRFTLGSNDLVFFDALAGQIGLALDRNRLTALELRQHQQARRELQRELDELHDSIKRSSLVYRSESMAKLLKTARRIAATDTTVLITGESGTGKEVLARTVHQLSKRSKKPLIVVDCSAIATSLIDSELFGHERGAFTGADRRSDGRLLEADGGTLLLDEIGELPLEVQSKLLRFVQEKQFTPVGSSQVKTVDVRVIALTNRDLASEVRAGKFREDLFHRLNVMRLLVPPLRERVEDIEYLATHFMKTFSVRYDREVTGLTPEGREALLGHTWPGNVRELQNRIMRGVVLAESTLLGPEELEFTADPGGPDPVQEHPDAAAGTDEPADPWEPLRRNLSRAIDRLLSEGAAHPPPLGKWLHEDMVLAASSLTGNVTSRSAALLGIPETTFRRKARSAQGNIAAGLYSRPPEWDSIRDDLLSLLRSGNEDSEDLLESARTCILEELSERLDGQVRTGAAFMGVTETTYRKWTSLIQAPGDTRHD